MRVNRVLQTSSSRRLGGVSVNELDACRHRMATVDRMMVLVVMMVVVFGTVHYVLAQTILVSLFGISAIVVIVRIRVVGSRRYFAKLDQRGG